MMFNQAIKKYMRLTGLVAAGLGLTMLLGLKTGLADTRFNPRANLVVAHSITIIGKDKDRVPQALQACIPPQVPQAILVSTAAKEGTSYYLFTAYDENGSDMLISLNPQGRCSLLLFRYPGDRIPWSQVAPIAVAQSLALEDIKGQAEELGGKAKYQRFLNAMAESGPSDWRPEEIWALKQLGFQVPRNFYQINTKTIKTTPPPQQ